MPRPRKPSNRGTRRLRLGGAAQTTSRRCSKLRYTSAEAAETAAQLRASHDPKYPDRLRVYYCRRCLGYHLTSQAKGDPSAPA
jgi:hypothetical protein